MPFMPDSAAEKWQYTQHAKVKHELLGKYLKGWSQITGSGVGKSLLAYVDGFAGRGEYCEQDGTVVAGSPVIALKQAPLWLEHTSHVSLSFVEKDAANFDNLKTVIDSLIPEDHHIEVHMFKGAFADAADRILGSIPRDTPTFFMIDPFGFGGVPFSVIKRILGRPRSEVFFTLMVRDMAHYLTTPSAEAALTELFGTDQWRTIAGTGQNREIALRDLYVSQIKREARTPFVWTFRVCMDEAFRTLYYLVHVTNHIRGIQLMKGIMYNQGGQGIPGTFAFLGPQDMIAKSQLSLFNDPEDVEPLKYLLLDHFRGRSVTFINCQAETIFLQANPCIEKHYRRALKELEAAGVVRIRRVVSKATGLADKDIIVFPDQDPTLSLSSVAAGQHGRQPKSGV